MHLKHEKQFYLQINKRNYVYLLEMSKEFLPNNGFIFTCFKKLRQMDPIRKMF